MSEKIFCVAPKYLDEFKCDGSKCGALCCRNDWTIFVDAETYKKYSALPCDEAQEILQHLRGYSSGEKYFIAHEKNCCPFLGEDNLCRIQKAHGENYLSQVCASYPRIITRLENFLEVALSLTCPLAAKIILLKCEPLQFEVVEASEKILRLGTNHILQGIPHELAPLIIELQFAMVKILQERRLKFDERLIILEYFLDRIDELISDGELDCAVVKWLAEVYTSEKFLSSDAPLMLSSVNHIPAEKNLPPEFATVAENFLVNEIFLGAYPLRIDADILSNYKLLVKVYKIFRRQCYGVRSVDEILSVASDLSFKIDHDDDYLANLADSEV